MSKKRKIIVLSVMLVLLVATAVLNYAIAVGGDFGGGDEGVVTGNFFSTYRSERTASRNMEIAYLESIIATDGAEYETARTEAMDQKLKILSLMDQESMMEYMLVAYGFEDAVVTMSSTSSNVNVIVRSDLLSAQDNAIIYMTLYEEAGVNPNYVRIIPI